MLLGTALILGALSLFLYNYLEAIRAEHTAGSALTQLQEAVEERRKIYPDPYDQEMTITEIDGYGYVGYLSIPAIDLELPVMAKWDYTRLKRSPCRYSGSTKTNDLVICAHNYVRHFGPIRNLSPGDQIFFTDMDGLVWQYEVAVVETLAPTAVEDMTAGGYDLTLFTCTYSGQSRVTVRCDRIAGGM